MNLPSSSCEKSGAPADRVSGAASGRTSLRIKSNRLRPLLGVGGRMVLGFLLLAFAGGLFLSFYPTSNTAEKWVTISPVASELLYPRPEMRADGAEGVATEMFTSLAVPPAPSAAAAGPSTAALDLAPATSSEASFADGLSVSANTENARVASLTLSPVPSTTANYTAAAHLSASGATAGQHGVDGVSVSYDAVSLPMIPEVPSGPAVTLCLALAGAVHVMQQRRKPLPARQYCAAARLSTTRRRLAPLML